MSSLFEKGAPHPLADRLRPQRLADIVGQDHLLGPEGPIGRMVASRQLASMILWGPPGCGKTTIARLLAHGTDLVFEPLSAVFSCVADLRKVFDAAKKRRDMVQALAAWDTYDRLGSPENELAIARCLICLATAPKSNAAYNIPGSGKGDHLEHNMVRKTQQEYVDDINNYIAAREWYRKRIRDGTATAEDAAKADRCRQLAVEARAADAMLPPFGE